MLSLTFYNLSVRIETSDYILLNHIREFLDKFYTSKSQGFNKAAGPEVRVYGSKLKDKPVYYLHTNQFIHLYHHLEKLGITLKPDEKIDKREYDVVETDFQPREGWELRDNQKPISEFLLDNPVKSKLVPAQTGSGKTVLSLLTIAKIKQRLGIVILPTFIEKWAGDIATIHEARTDDVMIIQGSRALAAIIEMAKTDSLDNDYIIFSNRTLQEYINQYEENPDLCVDMYGCAPIELFPLLGIGVMLIDESHMQFHSIFRILIHTNVRFQIGLSATLLSDDHVVTRMHKIVYPNKCIYQGTELDRYADVYAIAYTINETFMRFIKTKNYGSNAYSHIAFEQSIIKRNDMLQRYIRLIKCNIDDYYLEEYKEKDKLLIFVSTINLATRLVDSLKSFYPDFKIRRYCEEDSYEDMLGGDIIVSTVLSAGTGLDIPHLRVCIQTVCISSQVSNIQSLGRLRKLSDRDVKFCYLYANNIGKHKDYHMKRVELFKPRVANIAYRQSSASM